MGKKISGITENVTPLTGSELMEFVQDGITKKGTTQDIADLVPGGATPNLQQVTDEGFITSNLVLSTYGMGLIESFPPTSTTSAVAFDLDTNGDGKPVVKFSNGDTTTVGMLKMSNLSGSNQKRIELPNVNGTLVATVNGTAPDVNGNVVVASGGVQSIVEGNNITVDNTDPLNPVVSSSSSLYKVYVALLTQSGTNAPVATVLENTLVGTPIWTRTGAGIYVATLVGAFIANKTVTFLQNGNTGDIDGIVTKIIRNNQNSVMVVVFGSGTGENYNAGDGGLNNTAVEIRIYN